MKTNKTLLSLVTAAAVAGALSMAYAEADPAAPLTPVTPSRSCGTENRLETLSTAPPES